MLKQYLKLLTEQRGDGLNCYKRLLENCKNNIHEFENGGFIFQKEISNLIFLLRLSTYLLDKRFNNFNLFY